MWLGLGTVEWWIFTEEAEQEKVDDLNICEMDVQVREACCGFGFGDGGAGGRAGDAELFTGVTRMRKRGGRQQSEQT